MITCSFNNTITERDMDILLAQAVVTDPGVCRLLIDKTEHKGKPFTVKKVEISKENKLGESDVTVIVEIDGDLHGLLIEDKIDASAQPDQHERYAKRGDLGKKEGDYNDYSIFIFCPVKYYKNNSEAKLYEHVLTYEECKEYFDGKDDPLSSFRSQQLAQGISKAKRTPSSEVDARSNTFLRQYIQYQREHYPSLDLSTREDRNGGVTDFRTELGYVYINHKIEKGYVDLTFPKAADKLERVKLIAEWAREHNLSEVSVVKATVGAMIRIHVPKFDIQKGFECVDAEDLNKCFDAIKELTDFANMIETANKITLR